MNNKNKIKRLLFVLVQALVVFAPLLYFVRNKNSQNTFYSSAFQNNMNFILYFTGFLIITIAWLIFRNPFFQGAFYGLLFASIWVYSYGILDSISQALKDDRKLLYIDLD